MPEQNTYVFEGKDGTPLTFVGERPPTSAEMEQLAGVKKAAAPATPDKTPMSHGGTGAALAGSAAAASAPVVQNILEHIATNPNTPRMAAQAGRIIGGIAPVVGETVGGAAVAGLPGAIGGFGLGLAGAAKGAWAGGKTGWFSGVLAQKVSAPIAQLLEKASPYLKQAGPILGAYGAEGEALQQLNSPESIAEYAKHLTADQQTKLDTMLKAKAGGNPEQDIAAVKKLIADGTPPSAAVREIAGENPTKFGSLMTLYLRSRQVK